MISINTNMSAVKLQNIVGRTNNSLTTVLNRMSTGYRINSASDGAAELTLSKGLEVQSSGLSVANENISMAQNILSIGEGSLSNIQDMTLRIRDLALTAANGGYGSQERSALQQEAKSLVDEMERQLDSTKYNNFYLFDATQNPGSTTLVNSSEVIGTTGSVGTVEAVGTYSVTQLTKEEAETAGYTWVEDLETFQTELAKGSSKICLGSSIDLSSISDWTNTTTFSGELNGNGYTISGLTSTTQGLFKEISTGTVQNLTLSNVNIENSTLTGTDEDRNGLGALAGKISDSANILNVSSSGTVSYIGSDNCVHTGGLIGTVKSSSATLTSLSSSCDVSGVKNTGGLVGNSNAAISNCYATGNVTGNAANAGGLVGYAGGSVSNCYATGNVTSNANFAGGLAGIAGGSVSNCYATGNVTSNANYAGGLVGRAGGSVSNCYATGNVSGAGIGIGGLLAGICCIDATVSNCYVTGNVSGTSNANAGLIAITLVDNLTVANCYATGDVKGGGFTNGGLIGQLTNYDSSSATTNITNCYATGNVSGLKQNGGLIAYSSNVANVIISSCYATGDVSGTDDCNGGFIGRSNNSANLNISNCYAKGNVSATGNSNGSFAGWIGLGTFSNSYATGNVTGVDYNGGFIGQLRAGIFSNCYATGNVVGASANGGFIGLTYQATVSNCYATGNISGAKESGGFIGRASVSGNLSSISNSYSRGQVTGTGTNEKLGGFVGRVDAGGSLSLSNYAFSSQVSSIVQNTHGVGDNSGTQTGLDDNANKSGDWFYDSANTQSMLEVGSGAGLWDYTYSNPTLKSLETNNIVDFQIGANAGDLNKIEVDLSFSMLGVFVDLSTQDSARGTLTDLDTLLTNLSKKQSEFGTNYNILDSISNNNTTTIINLDSANSRIIDADMAEESSEFVKCQILQNAATSLLAQTGTSSQSMILALYGIG